MHHIIFRVCLTNDIYRYTGVNKRNTSIRALNCLHISVMLHQRQGNSPRWSISDEFYRRMVKPTKSNVIAIELSPSCRAGGNFRVNGQYWVHQSRTDCDTYSTEHGLHRTAYPGSGVLGMLTVILNEFWLPHLTISSWTWFAGKNTTRHNQHLLISTQTNYREVKPKESLIRQYMSVWPTYRGGGWRLICRVIVAHCKTASQYSIICDSLNVEFLLMIHIK